MTKKNTPFDAAWLQRRVLPYVARFLSTEARLRAFIDRVLMRARNRGEVTITASDIEHIVGTVQKKGFIDDARFALARVQRWHQSGLSLAAMQQRLQAEQIDQTVINGVIAEFCRQTEGGQQTHDRTAAWHYARKRSIGPFRQQDRDAWYQRDLGKLARRGFNRDTAIWLLAQDSPSQRQH